MTVALQGDSGKPRPAVIIETDRLPQTDSVLVCLMTPTLHEDTPFRRHPVEASPSTGLRAVSHVMVDKIFAVRRNKCGAPIGAVEATVMTAITRKLALVIGIADASAETE